MNPSYVSQKRIKNSPIFLWFGIFHMWYTLILYLISNQRPHFLTNSKCRNMAKLENRGVGWCDKTPLLYELGKCFMEQTLHSKQLRQCTEKCKIEWRREIGEARFSPEFNFQAIMSALIFQSIRPGFNFQPRRLNRARPSQKVRELICDQNGRIHPDPLRQSGGIVEITASSVFGDNRMGVQGWKATVRQWCPWEVIEIHSDCASDHTDFSVW
jgi:hypothetical protein